MSIYVTVAGDPKSGDPNGVKALLEERYASDAATWSVDVAFLPGQGYVVSSATRRQPIDPSVRTDRTGPFKMPPAEDATEDVRSFLKSQGIALYP